MRSYPRVDMRDTFLVDSLEYPDDATFDEIVDALNEIAGHKVWFVVYKDGEPALDLRPLAEQEEEGEA